MLRLWLRLCAVLACVVSAVVEVEVGADGSLPEVAARAAKSAQYPFDAETRRYGAQLLASQLNASDLDGDWEAVRGLLLGACGLRDERRARPGEGNTGHCFADWNHVDCCTMASETADSENRGKVAGIAPSNFLGAGIRAASVAVLGDGGSWCTCTMGSARAPPGDVCHVQFNARPAWKLVWCEDGDDLESFVLVDDFGNLLSRGRPSGRLPGRGHRLKNAREFAGSKYGAACRARASRGSGAI